MLAGDYTMDVSAYRAAGGLVERYSRVIAINETTGYIREMRLHPMVQMQKLPAGGTGPLEITLGLRTNLPQTNVLTWGKFDIQIRPNLPLPNVNINGVPKCYFYGDIEASDCNYDASDPDFTLITLYTPVDFNFQSSEIPFMVTTEGYTSPEFEGLTIDSLVKRYDFQIQFYTDTSPNVPTEVIYTDWIAEPLELDTVTCEHTTNGQTSWDHITCSITSPPEALNEPTFFHIFRIEFTNLDSALGYEVDQIYPDFPCVAYGANLVADPYIKCDLVTWTLGTYASVNALPYINIYGFEELPPNSTFTVEFPRIKRGPNLYWGTSLQMFVMQDTTGFQTQYITLYSSPAVSLDTI